MRIVLSFLCFGPYHLARFAASRSLGSSEGHLVVGLGMAERQTQYAWEATSSESVQVVSESGSLESVPASEWGELIARRLRENLPDVVAIAGYSHPSMLFLLRHCDRAGIPVVLMSESQGIDSSRIGIVEFLKSRLVRLYSSALVGGAPHRAYLRGLGMADERIFEGYDAVDNDHFARESARWRTHDGPQPPCFLASNRFIEKKNLFRLLSAYLAYFQSTRRRTKDQGQRTMDAWPLILLGDGELKPALLDHAATLGLSILDRAPWESTTKNEEPGTRNRPEVYLPGFRQIDELPRFYAHAGAFVHASTTEQWGLVVNEAMASGLPVIVSNRCGCAPDLVKDGENGWAFDPLDEAALAGFMGRVAAMDAAERGNLGEQSRAIVAQWGPERFASGLIAAAEKALEVGPKRAGWVDRLLLKALIARDSA